jgi:hypothetical protein
MRTHTYENGVTLTLAQRLAMDAVEYHRARLYATARERASAGASRLKARQNHERS